MRNFLGLTTLFFVLVGVSVAQHHSMGGGHFSAPASHLSPPQMHQQPPHNAPPAVNHPSAPVQGVRGYQGYRSGYQSYRSGYQSYQGYRGGGYRGSYRGYDGWYANRPEYRNFHWGHYYGWHYRSYTYLGMNYCYAGAWGDPYFTFGFNSPRWRVLDFDLAVVNGWYPGGCAYVTTDPYHYGWYLLYDEQTGQYVHVEQY